MSEWKKYSLEDVCETIVDCVNKTAPKVNYETPYKMIRTTNVKDGRIDLNSVFNVTEQIYKKWTRRLLPEIDDVILTREAPLGEIGIIRTNDKVFLGQRLMQYRANKKVIEPYFLYYSLQAPYLQHQINASGTGSTVSHIRVPDASKFEILLPSLNIQKSISTILRSLDDKIEVNYKMNETLEEMAMTLYKNLFVDGSEHELISLNELIEINPRTSLKKGSMTTFVDMKAISDGSLSVKDIDIFHKEFKSGSKFVNGDTLMARITPCFENGKVAFVDFLEEKAVGGGSTEFLVLRANEGVSPQYVYCLSRDKQFRNHAKLSMFGTSGRQRVQKDSVHKYEIKKPDPHLMKKFDAITKPYFEQIRANTKEVHYLEKTRDYLLPRLLSGEIDLSEAEEKVQEVTL